jgi:MFS family permease
MLAAMMCFGTLLIVFSYSSWPPVSVLLLVGVGASFTTYNASNNSLLQMIVPDEFRGRILSTLFINRGLVPLGTALAGTLAVVVGIQLTVASMAAIVALLGFLLLTSAPTLRRLK